VAEKEQPEVIKPPITGTPNGAFALAWCLLAIGVVTILIDGSDLLQGSDRRKGQMVAEVAMIMLAVLMLVFAPMILRRKLLGLGLGVGTMMVTVVAVASWFVFFSMDSKDTESPGYFHAAIALIFLALCVFAMRNSETWIRCGGWEARETKFRPYGIPDEKIGKPCPKCDRPTSIDWNECVYCKTSLKKEAEPVEEEHRAKKIRKVND
jgi:uncharacterized integral membrane protein